MEAQSCNSCEPCGLDGIKTCDLCITMWPIMYLAQPTCMTYPPGCDNLIECHDGLALSELIAEPNWAEIGDFERSHPGTFEYFSEREVLIVREPCARQIVAVLEVPEQHRALVAGWGRTTEHITVALDG